MFKEYSQNIHFLGGINNRIDREKCFDISNNAILILDDKVGYIKATKENETSWKIESKDCETFINFKEWRAFTSDKGYSAWYRLVRSLGKVYLIRTPVWKMEYSSNRNNIDVLNKSIRNNPFIADSLRSMYREGIFGKQFYHDGDGTAEDIFMDLYKLSFEYYKIVLKEYLKYDENYNKMRIIYAPFTDGIGHELIGFIRSNLEIPTKYTEKAIELLLEVYTYADKLLGIVYEKEKKPELEISSDHGMNGVSTMFHPNDLLLKTGYVQRSKTDFELYW